MMRLQLEGGWDADRNMIADEVELISRRLIN